MTVVINTDHAVLQKGGDYAVLVFLVPLVCMARLLCENLGSKYFQSTDTGKSLLRKKKHHFETANKKFKESSWKFAYYTCSLIYGLLFISWESFLLQPFGHYPNICSPKLYWFYMVQTAFYLWMSVCHVYDARRKVFYQMATHHLVTLVLLVFSYTYSVFYVGALLMIIHDFADPFLEAAKMLIYLKKETLSTACFSVFMTSFIVMRLVVYPLFAIYPSITQANMIASKLDVMWLYYMLNGAMILLLCLNVFWSILIVKVLLRKCQGNTIKDTRSDDESD